MGFSTVIATFRFFEVDAHVLSLFQIFLLIIRYLQ